MSDGEKVARAGYVGCEICFAAAVVLSILDQNVNAALAWMVCMFLAWTAWQFWKQWGLADADVWEAEELGRTWQTKADQIERNLLLAIRTGTFWKVPDGCPCDWDWNPEAGWYPFVDPACPHHGDELREYLESL